MITTDFEIRDGDLCACCGTDLFWWLGKSKRNKVYVNPAEELFCKKNCMKEYHEPFEYTITRNVTQPTGDLK